MKQRISYLPESSSPVIRLGNEAISTFIWQPAMRGQNREPLTQILGGGE